MSIARVLIDGFFLGKPYGFGRFIAELCRALGQNDTGMEFIVAVPDRISCSTLPRYAGLTWHSAPERNFILWEQSTLPRLAKRLSCDVIHFPYNTKAFFTHSIPTVTTVHDVLFLQEHVSLRDTKAWLASSYARWVFRASIKYSKVVVCVSQTTASALDAMGIESSVVYNTVDGFTSATTERRSSMVEGRYFLHRGGYAAHRNTLRVIEAFQAVKLRLGDVKLKILGAPAGCDRWQVDETTSVQFLPRISDDELAALYAGSLGVVATSLEEGFGLPIIEGFGFGVPVITSNINPMQEIAGDAALIVDPFSAHEIGEAMVSLASDAALVRSLNERGAARALLFSSSNVAMQMARHYARCLPVPGHRR